MISFVKFRYCRTPSYECERLDTLPKTIQKHGMTKVSDIITKEYITWHYEYR